MIFGLEQEGGSLIAPMALAHPLHPIDNGSRNRRRNLWVGWCVSSWWPLLPFASSVFIYIYIYAFSMSSVTERIYTYNRSVIQYWWSCTPSHSVGLYFWGVRSSWVECHFCFLWFTNCVLLSDDNTSGVVSPRGVHSGCALVIARHGKTTPSGVWHQQYTHNHVWSLKHIPWSIHTVIIRFFWCGYDAIFNALMHLPIIIVTS